MKPSSGSRVIGEKCCLALAMALVLVQAPSGRQDGIPASKPFAPGVVRIPQEGVAPPTVVRKFNPKYTPAADEAGLDGTVILQCVVKRDGTVGDVRVVKSLDKIYGLDDQAVAAVRKWQFKPAARAEGPIDSVIELDFTFTHAK